MRVILVETAACGAGGTNGPILGDSGAPAHPVALRV
jgi:hypothetical protein